MQLFSDREGVKRPQRETISNRIWKGITAIIQRFIGADCLSKDFPQLCPDGNGICGFDSEDFNNVLSATIPIMHYPFPSFEYLQSDPWAEEEEQYTESNIQYGILDTIEFVYSHIYGAIKDPKHYHSFFNHYELSFSNGITERESFREAINQLFERNGISFRLIETGQIIRNLTPLIDEDQAHITTADKKVHDLLTTSLEKIHNPRFEERKLGLEKLWDAFERIKTVYDQTKNKSDSINKLLGDISSGNDLLQSELSDECRLLTNIGNKFQIRHFESDTKPIDDPNVVDYFYCRMFALLKLLLTKIPNTTS